MDATADTTLRIREFTRREKTCIRQDVKRFEKIGRDHHCNSLEDYVDFVRERIRVTDEGGITTKSLLLIRGLIAYFGDRLIRQTTMERVATTLQHTPGSLVRDPQTFQTVFIANLIFDHLIADDLWAPSLDEIMDELIDWNDGYLDTEDVQTDHAWDPTTGLREYLIA